MTFIEAVSEQALWIRIWLVLLVFGAFFLPFALLVWRQTRLTAVFVLICSALAAVGVQWTYDMLGYVRLLGLPHIILWTPAMIVMALKVREPGLPRPASRVLLAVMTIIAISLAFDYVDFVRYFLGDRAPFPGTGPAT